MATNGANDIQIIENALAAGSVFIAGVAAVYHFIFKRGQKSAEETNHDNFIEDRVEKLEQRLSVLEEDIKNYRDANSQKLDKIIENQNKLSNDVSFIKGKMSKRDKSSPAI